MNNTLAYLIIGAITVAILGFIAIGFIWAI